MTAPTRTFAPQVRKPPDVTPDSAVLDGGSLAGPKVDAVTPSRLDADRQQRTLGNLAVLKQGGDGAAGARAASPARGAGDALRDGGKPASAGGAGGSDVAVSRDQLAAPPRPVALEPPAAVTPAAPEIPSPGPVEAPVLHPTGVSAIGDVQREVSKAASALPRLDSGAFTAAQAAQRAQGFRLARTGGGAREGAPSRGGGGGAQEPQGDRPREPDPVPAQTKALVEVGKKKLPDVPRYGFNPTPYGRVPVLGSRPFTSSEMLVLKNTAKGELAEALAREDGKRIADRKVREDAFNAAEAKKLEGEGGKKKGGKDTPAAKFEDDGPKTYGEMRQMLLDVPKPPEVADLAKKKEKDKAVAEILPPYHEPEPPPPIAFKPAQKEDIGRALAGLRAEGGVTAVQILSGIRKSVYSSGLIGPVLESDAPTIGLSHLPQVRASVDAKVTELQKGAGITDQELEKAVAARREELRRLREQMAKGSTQEEMDAQRAAAEKTKKEAAEVAAKKEAADIRAGKVKKAAPKVKLAMDVDSRRERLLGYVTKDVSDLVVRFKQKGEIRDSVVARMHNDFANAYKFAAQQDEYEIIRKSNDPVSARFGFTPVSAATGEAQEKLDEWLKARLADVEANKKAQKVLDDLVVAGYQAEARQLGDAKREAIRAWAEKRSGKKRTAEQKAADTARDKATQMQADAAAIEQLGRARLAVGVMNDFGVASAIAAEVQKGSDRATIIANLRLNAAQQAILDAYLTPGEPGDDRALSAVMAATRGRIQAELQGPIAADIEASILTEFGERMLLLDRIGNAQRDGFSAMDIAQKVHKALDSMDTDEGTVYDSLANLTKIQAQAIRLAYKALYPGKTIEGDMKGGAVYGMSGNELRRAQKLMDADQASADAIGHRIALKGNEGTWYNAVNPFSTADIEELDKINHGKSLEERQAAEDAYNAMYDDALSNELLQLPPNVRAEKDPKKRAELLAEHRRKTFEKYRKDGKSQLLADADEELQKDRHKQRFRFSVAGDDESADALALRDHLPTPAEIRQFEEDMARQGHPGMGKLVTGDRKKIEAIYERIRTEAKARGQRSGWTPDQVEAEIARRSAKVERAFNHHFSSQYENTSGSVLRAAFDTGFREHPEQLNLVNALADNDLRKADAARIMVEHKGVWADDDIENAVLAKQYERRLERERQVAMPLQRVVMARQLVEMEKEARDGAYAAAKQAGASEAEARQRAKAAWTGAREWEERERLQRAVDRSIEKVAQEQAKGDMDALRKVFKADYHLDLDTVVLGDTSGYDNQKAAKLLQQGGHLTLGQTMFFAVRGNGTDEEALNALKGHTSAEIDEARKEFRTLALDDRWTARGILNRAWSSEPHDDLDMDAEIKDDISGRTGFDVTQMLKGEPETIFEKRERLKEAIDWERESGPLGDWLAGDQQTALDSQLTRLDATILKLSNPDLSAEERKLQLGFFSQDVASVHAGIEAHREMLDTWTDRITTVVGFIVGVAVTILTFGAAGLVLAAVLGSVLATASTIAIKAAILGAAYGWEDLYTDIAVGVVDAVAAAATAGMGEKLIGAVKNAAAPAASRFAFGRSVQCALQGGGRAAFLNPAEGALAKAIPKSAMLESMVKRGGISKILAVGMAEGAENLVANIPSALATSALDDNNYKEGNFITNVLAGTAKQAGMSVGMGLALKPVMKGAGSVLEVMGKVKDAAFKGQPIPRFDSFEVVRSRYPDITVEEYSNLRKMHESEVGMRDRAARESRAEAGESSPAAREAARDATDAVPSKERLDVPDDATLRGRGGDDADMVSHRAMDEGQVRELLPAGMRETLKVQVDPTASPDSIKVERVKRLGVIVGVQLVVGPKARPMDVLAHIGTVHAMQRYVGVTGAIVRAVEYARSWIVKNGPPPFGTKAWEAWHELHKLPRMLEDRFELLRSGALDPKAREAIFADIDRISRHVDHFRSTLEMRDLSPGVGHIAAPGEKAPRAWGSRKIPPSDRGNPAHERFDADHSALAKRKEYSKAIFEQVDRSWREMEGGQLRTYRVLEVRDPVTRELLVRREEIQSIDSAGQPVKHWVQRGSEGNVTGEIGEEAFRNQFHADQADSKRQGQVLLPASVIQRGGGQGFDGVIVHFNDKGVATLILVEVKNYPGRYVPRADITAIRENLNANLRHLEAQLNDVKKAAALGLSPTQAAAVRDAIAKNRMKFELQLGDTTNLGQLGASGSSVLRDVRADVSRRRRFAFDQADVTAQRMAPEHMRASEQLAEARARLDSPAELHRLAKGDGTVLTAAGVRRAEATITAQRQLAGLATTPLRGGSGGVTFLDAQDRPFVVFAPERGASGAAIAADLGRTLRDTRGGPDPRTHVILDETHLSAPERVAVQQELARLAAIQPELDLGLVVVVNVSTGTAARLKLATP
ncbi:MAG: hypothetical protein IT355_06145 [Gemmatimonadaceae bacterium]|nr:hypothetical protein [Gemmatimonadaceae bacterium]